MKLSSILLMCLVFLLLADTSLAQVNKLEMDGEMVTFGCSKFGQKCYNNPTKDRCCNGGYCISNRCVPHHTSNVSICGATHEMCFTGLEGSGGCCSANEECVCYVTEDPICICSAPRDCLKENADCTSQSKYCCPGFSCKCDSNSENCKCIIPPPPGTGLSQALTTQAQTCIAKDFACGQKSKCCSGLRCLRLKGKADSYCSEPPPPRLFCAENDQPCFTSNNVEVACCNTGYICQCDIFGGCYCNYVTRMFG